MSDVETRWVDGKEYISCSHSPVPRYMFNVRCQAPNQRPYANRWNNVRWCPDCEYFLDARPFLEECFTKGG